MYMDDAIHIEKTDQCYSCAHFVKNVSCPLLEALAVGVVELSGEMTVQNCSFYEKFSRHLRVLEGAKSDETPAESDKHDGDDNVLRFN